MIVEDKLKINISYRNVTHYRKLGYDAIIGEELEVLPTDLSLSSHQKVTAKCEICKGEKVITYHKYIVNKNRCGFYGCKSCSRQKAIMTSRKLYGVDNYTILESSKEKIAENNIKKYGVKTTLLHKETSDKIKNTMINKYGTDKYYEIRNGNGKRKKLKFLNIEDKENDIKDPSMKYKDIYDESYLLYRNEVRRLSIKSSKKLLDQWNGYDFYDNEFIKENFNLTHNDVKYPTIDHKISIYYGYNNQIPPSEISNISNLCVTKRCINSSKRDPNFIKN